MLAILVRLHCGNHVYFHHYSPGVFHMQADPILSLWPVGHKMQILSANSLFQVL